MSIEKIEVQPIAFVIRTNHVRAFIELLNADGVLELVRDVFLLEQLPTPDLNKWYLSLVDGILAHMRFLWLLAFWCSTAFGQTFFPAPTPTPIPTPIITQVTATSTTVTVIWTEVGNPASADMQYGYYVLSYGTTLGAYTVVMQTENTMQMSLTVTGLSTQTTYYFTVQYIIPLSMTATGTQSLPSGVAAITTLP
jgi:hypothetical protein